MPPEELPVNGQSPSREKARTLPRADLTQPCLVCYNPQSVPPGGIGVAEVSGKGSHEMRDQQHLISEFVNRRVWAVVGASCDPRKFGYQVFRSLRDAGYEVYPVNLKGGELEGAKVYRSLADLPQPPEVIDMVVPPAVTEQVVQEAHELGLTRVWMQPGAESEASVLYCHQHGMQVVQRACAMVWKRSWD